MKKITIDFPVIGWGSVEIEVEDDLGLIDVEDMIREGEIDVLYNGVSECPCIPMFDISEAYDVIQGSEVPERLTAQ